MVGAEELLKYSWIIDGSKLGDKESEFITTISLSIKNLSVPYNK